MITHQVDEDLRRGALAVGMIIASTLAARPWEIIEMFRVAAAHKAAVHVHMSEIEGAENDAWEQWSDRKFARLEWPATGERLTRARIQMGADADIVVFDAARIIDRATYREPTLPPLGLRDILVNGVVVVRNATVRPGVLPGRAVRAATDWMDTSGMVAVHYHVRGAPQ